MIVLDCTKSAEAHLVDVSFEGTERSDEDVDSEVEFLSTDKKRVVDVAGNNVSISCRLLRDICPRIRPFFQLRKLKISVSFCISLFVVYFVNEENANASCFSARLHNPC